MKNRRFEKPQRLSVAEELLLRLTPERRAADHEAALRWRQQLRAEAEGGAQIAPAPIKRPAVPDRWRAEQQAKFAEAIARAEFGRFYWKDSLRRRVRRQAGLDPISRPAATK